MRWVFHRGALGDSVLLWPRLRVWARDGVVLVTDGAKGRLAARELGITALNAEQARFNALWRAGAALERVERVTEVLDYLGGSEVYAQNLGAMFPGARVVRERPPRGGLEGAAWARMNAGAHPEPRDNPRGPVVLHVGAGDKVKRWPMERWEGLARLLGGQFEVMVIAGEVEADRFGAAERIAFSRMGGVYLGAVSELADVLRGACLVVACDSGPGHLTAQLGVRILSLFGPTDPAVWAPVGPRVEVLAPAPASSMGWLSVEAVAQRASQLAPEP